MNRTLTVRVLKSKSELPLFSGWSPITELPLSLTLPSLSPLRYMTVTTCGQVFAIVDRQQQKDIIKILKSPTSSPSSARNSQPSSSTLPRKQQQQQQQEEHLRSNGEGPSREDRQSPQRDGRSTLEKNG